MAAPDSMSTATTGLAPRTVVVENLVVTYRVRSENQLGARQLMKRGFRSRTMTEVEALRGLSFDVHAGEAVGLVGSNGSGKSTLLRTIAGLQPKSEGSVFVTGQPQFLGVAAALKLRLSGRRNIYLGGLALGLTVEEVDERYDDVVAFSGLGEALARPLQTYSSGMRSRLAFSIATLTSPEILLLDEALAVGDRAFRDRSVRRIQSIRDDAKTVMLVTHNLTEIQQTCERVLWLRDGQIVMDGAVDEVLDAYGEWSDRNAED